MNRFNHTVAFLTRSKITRPNAGSVNSLKMFGRLWNECVQKAESLGKKQYMTTRFGDKYRAWVRITKETMRIHHDPRDAMQVDWAGDTLPIYDSETSEITPACLFIAVLLCSCYVYAEATADIKFENWLNCHAHAYEYFGGVPRLLILDNLQERYHKEYPL